MQKLNIPEGVFFSLKEQDVDGISLDAAVGTAIERLDLSIRTLLYDSKTYGGKIVTRCSSKIFLQFQTKLKLFFC